MCTNGFCICKFDTTQVLTMNLEGLKDNPNETRNVSWLHPQGVLRCEEAACSIPMTQKASWKQQRGIFSFSKNQKHLLNVSGRPTSKKKKKLAYFQSLLKEFQQLQL